MEASQVETAKAVKGASQTGFQKDSWTMLHVPPVGTSLSHTDSKSNPETLSWHGIALSIAMSSPPDASQHARVEQHKKIAVQHNMVEWEAAKLDFIPKPGSCCVDHKIGKFD